MVNELRLCGFMGDNQDFIQNKNLRFKNLRLKEACFS